MDIDVREEVLLETELAERPVACNLTANPNCTSHPGRVELYDGSLEAVIVPCVCAVILVVGVIGNALLIVSFARHKTLNTPHNALVVNLASGDFIFLIISLPFNSLWYTLPDWPFGVTICKLTHFAEYLATAVVISTLSILSVERCLIATGKKLWRQQKRGPILLILTVWAVSLIVALPDLISATVVERVINNNTSTHCEAYNKSWGAVYLKSHVICKFIFFFCLPLLIIATSYTIIAFHLLSRAFPRTQKNKKSDKEKKKCLLRNSGSNKKDEEDTCRCSSEVGNHDTTKHTNSAKKHCKFAEDKTAEGHQKGVEQLQLKAKSSKVSGDDDKSSSPDSCTEMTELQQTPVLPYAFVYTGPIPAGLYPIQEPRHSSKGGSNAAGDVAKSDAMPRASPEKSSAVAPGKETTPLNQRSGEAKGRGYKHRRQTMVTKRRRLALTVLMLILSFVICWTPRQVYQLWYHCLPGEYNIFWHVFKIIGFCLSFSNSAVNPIVFYVLDTTFRSFVHNILCMICIKQCQPKRSPAGEAVVTIAERDYNATIAMTEMKTKGNVTEL